MSIPKVMGEVAYVDTEQMIEVDRAMVEDFHIDLIQMMENAGRNLAALGRERFLDGDPIGKRIAIMAGSGGNGGGALVAARRLHNWGSDVLVLLGQAPEAMTGVPWHQLNILRRMGVAGADVPAEPGGIDMDFDLILDGLIGYSLKGAPYGLIAELIRWANNCGSPLLSLDTPSGLDTTTGTVFEPAIRAEATMTLALPKAGLHAPRVRANVGELYLADISVPPALYAQPTLALNVGPLFAEADIIRIRDTAFSD